MAISDTAPSLTLDAAAIADLQTRLPDVATHTIAAIMEEVPAYAGPFGGPMGKTIAQAVQVALAGFLKLASSGRMGRGGTPLTPALEGAYALGRGEARQGRSADALLAAYRVGARVSWRELSAALVAHRVPAATVAAFAELVFAYIDELSAASVAGHADQVESTGRRRERSRELLALALLRGDGPEALAVAAEAAEWSPPRSLTVVLLPEAQVRSALAVATPSALVVGEAPDLVDSGTAVLLVPDAAGGRRTKLVRELAGRHAVVGPATPWLEVHRSYRRALRAVSLGGGAEAVDTDRHLAVLVLTADPEALADLRERALAPLADLKPAAREKLEATLRSWLLHHGRREEVAAELFVHPQTVRYRMGQLRELYGDRLDDPATVLDLTVALGATSG
ncbi:MAG: helix-turn-helix domain-containing protein [Nocardioides sp.]